MGSKRSERIGNDMHLSAAFGIGDTREPRTVSVVEWVVHADSSTSIVAVIQRPDRISLPRLDGRTFMRSVPVDGDDLHRLRCSAQHDLALVVKREAAARRRMEAREDLVAVG